MFSSIWLIWKVVAIRFSHRKKCLIVTSFDIVPSATLYLNQFFCFYLYLNIKKVVFLLKTNNLYKPQTFFLIRAILPLICWRVFLGDPHIHLTFIISRLIQFQMFYIFLKDSYTVNTLLKMLLFWTFWTFNLPLDFNILHSPNVHLLCQTSVYIINLSFFNLICAYHDNMLLTCLYFKGFLFTWHAPIMSIIHDTFYFYLTCT